MSRSLLIGLLVLLGVNSAQACMFVRNVQPEGWYEWSAALFAGEVTNVEQDREKALDTITVKVTETFKGPAADTAAVTIPVRLRTACKLELPVIGAQILVALNANNDSAWVPLSEAYAAKLRGRKP